VNPRYEEILGRRCYPSLAAAAEAGEAPEIVDVFRKPEEVPALAEEAIEVGAKVLWLQLGIEHQDAAERAVAAGLDVVMNRCVKIEHARFFGGLHAVGLNTGVISSKIAEG
jgi:predicted CoA-binding protein